MLKVYGTMQCPDCVDCKRVLDNAGIAYEFKNVEELLVLKEFLQLRDNNAEFAVCKQEGYIGIPCLVLDDGKITLDFNELVESK